MPAPRMYPLDETLKALSALRNAAGLEPEQFPIQAFVGMISDEVESLRKRGHTDNEIVRIIEQNSAIKITTEELAEHYATPEQRQHHGE